MGGHQEGALLPELLQLPVQERRTSLVECTVGLVEHEQPRVVEQGAAEGEPLQHSAREGADPAAVVFDAITSGKAKGRDPILVDTAGRLHTRVNLMNELDKIRRVAAREVDGAPHEVLLVLDATVGQNGLVQAREFMNVAGVNGVEPSCWLFFTIAQSK